MRRFLGLMILTAGTSLVAMGGNVGSWWWWWQGPKPQPTQRASEISADQAGSALALVAAVVLSIRGRRKQS